MTGGAAATRLGPSLSRHKRGVRTPAADPEPVQRHIAWLNSIGVNNAMIARAAGLPSSTPRRILDRTVHPLSGSAAAILDVTPRPSHHQGEVLAFGAQRRIRALMAIGWLQRTIAAEIGSDQRHISKILRRQRIHWETHAKVAEAYDRLAGEVTRTPRPGECPPASWLDIDDFFERPVKVAALSAIRLRRMRIDELGRDGLSAKEIADRLGVSQRTVERQQARNRKMK